jgi:phosphate-selective porin
MPDNWKQGRLSEADLVGFIRYSDLKPQAETPSGVAKNPANNQQEVTLGMSFYPVPNLVFKADYTFVDSDAGNVANRTDFGVGYAF